MPMIETAAQVLGWARDSCVIHHLTDARVVHVTGDDARSWLNGQTTNDVREVGPDEAVYALSVDVKGRIQADLWVVQEGEGMAFVAPASACPALLEALDRYIIMEDVELEPDEELGVVTLQGPRAERVRAAVPELRGYRTARLGAGGFDLWVPLPSLPEVLAKLTPEAAALDGGCAGEGAWDAAHVQLGIPRYGVDFGASTYPQEAGLKARAVSFDKGCYLGQEVICMLENRGKLGRRLVQLRGPAGATAAAGDTCQSEDGKRLGQVTSVVADEPPLALAFLKSAHARPDQSIRVGDRTWSVTAVVGDAV